MNQTMIEPKTEKKKKASVTEEDISTLLQRYTAPTVLALLQEVAQYPGAKINWNALVKKTSTGISNAREYQMLWRHLAYQAALPEKLEDGDEPLDDDSDLEYDLEAYPAVNGEASAEAAACVKMLIGSGLTSDFSLPNYSTVEAPLTINIPNGQSSRALSENSQAPGTNITIPASVQKQPLPTVIAGESSDANGLTSGNMPPRRKRKPWSEAEDLELIAAVQKCGEGNWANILKADFKGDRTASQLSQRWAIIRKRHGNLNVCVANSTGTQLSEAQLAARHAMSLALDMPVKNLRAGTSTNGSFGNSSQPTTTSESPFPSSSVGLAHHQPQQNVQPSKSSPVQSTSFPTKCRVPPKKASPKADISPNSMGLNAAAVAAGARIATPSDAASLLRAAQAKNAVHIIPTGSLVKPSIPGVSAAHSRVNFKGAGLTATSSASGLGHDKDAAPATSTVPSAPAKSSQKSSNASGVANEVPLKQESNCEEMMVLSDSSNLPDETIQPDTACVLDHVAQEVDDRFSVRPDKELAIETPVAKAKDLSNLEMAASDRSAAVSSQTQEGGNESRDKVVCLGNEACGNAGKRCEDQSLNDKPVDSSRLVSVEQSEKVDVVS